MGTHPAMSGQDTSRAGMTMLTQLRAARAIGEVLAAYPKDQLGVLKKVPRQPTTVSGPVRGGEVNKHSWIGAGVSRVRSLIADHRLSPPLLMQVEG